ncbi:MAG: GntR family transcriptional regulator [Succinivibrio sp.]|nr:GntR family transcriptional regulator [Succinivibrio sp.]
MLDHKLLPRLKLSSRKTLTAQIFDFLREQIVVRSIEPGTALYENDLAAHFGVSRQPIHEALTKLNAIALVDILPQKGTFVSKIRVSKLYEICFVRCALETHCTRQAAHCTEGEFAKVIKSLEKNLKQQQDLLSRPNAGECGARFLTLDDDFHRLICSFSKVPLVWETLENVKSNMDRIRYLSLGEFSKPENLIVDHQQILKAISEQEFEQACRLLEQHAYEITHTYKPIMQEHASWFLT